MSVSAEERSFRRRLVFNAMPETASTDVVNKCIEILENEFGHDPDIKYGELVKRLQEAVESNMNFSRIHGRIMIMKRKSAEEIGPDPGIAAGRSTAKLDAKDHVFNAMLASIGQQVRKRGDAVQSDFSVWLRENFSSAKCAREIEEWAVNTDRPPVVSGEEQELQAIINQCFVWMCGKFGPVDTDKILHRAILAADQIPEAVEFPPKQLM